MAQRVGTCKPDDLSLPLETTEGGEQTAKDPLTSTRALWHSLSHNAHIIHTDNNNNKIINITL